VAFDNKEHNAKNKPYWVNKGVAANELELNPLTQNEDPEAKEEDGGEQD
jgi:hypothetical protein